MTLFIQDGIGLVVSCAPIQFILNEETKFNDLPFLCFTIEEDRYILLPFSLIKNRFRCHQSGDPEICLLRFWHMNQFPDGISLFFFIWLNCILH